MVPKISYPTYTIEQPSIQKSFKFRPYLVKEEKILLMAKQTKEVEDAYQSIVTVLNACCNNPEFDADKIPLFDLEFMFAKLRGLSVNNIEKLQIKDPNDKNMYDIIVNFNEAKVNFPNPPIPLKIVRKGEKGKNISISLKYPNVSFYKESNEKILERLKGGDFISFIIPVIDQVFVGDNICNMSEEELKEFLENLDHNTFLELENFVASLPTFEIATSYTNSLGEEKHIYFRSLMDFFFFV